MASLHAFRPMSVVATPARPVAAAVRKCAVTERRRHHTHCMTDRQLFKTRPGCHWPASRDGTNSREAQKLGVSDHTNRFVENRIDLFRGPRPAPSRGPNRRLRLVDDSRQSPPLDRASAGHDVRSGIVPGNVEKEGAALLALSL